MARRLFFKFLPFLSAFIPLSEYETNTLLENGEIKIEDVTRFLIESKDGDGNKVYELNMYGDYYKLIATYIFGNKNNLEKCYRLRFESKTIYPYNPTEAERLKFRDKCLKNVRRNLLKPIKNIANKIIV